MLFNTFLSYVETTMSDDHVQVPILKPSELYLRRRTQETAKLKAYNQILAQIYHRIEVVSQLPNCPFYVLYTVPPFIFGLPKIDLQDCIVYLVYQLRMAGFETKYTYPNLIYISWQNHEKNYIIQESPIMKAMLDSSEQARREAERSEMLMNKRIKKIQHKTTGRLHTSEYDIPTQTTISYGRNTSSSYAPKGILKKRVEFQEPMSAGKPPSASDYVPPTVFLNTMERPSVRREDKHGLSLDLLMGLPPSESTSGTNIM